MFYSNIIDKILHNYQKGGTKLVIKRGLSKLGYIIFHTNSAFWYRNNLLSYDQNCSITVDSSINIDFDNTDDTVQFIKNYGYYYKEEINTAIKERHYLTALKINNKIIGYNKTGFNKVYIEDFKSTYNFPEKVAFTYDTFILPEYRNRGLASVLLHNVLTKLKDDGFVSIWAHIPEWNIASEKLHTKLGFQKICFVRYIHLLFFSFLTRNIFDKILFIENSNAY